MQEAKPYKSDPEVKAMTDLVAAYQSNNIKEFEKVLRSNRWAGRCRGARCCAATGGQAGTAGQRACHKGFDKVLRSNRWAMAAGL